MPYIRLPHDYRIHYQLLHGDTALPWVVFLHDGLGCGLSWGTFPQLLCNTLGCPGLIYDRLGHGKSSPLHRKRTIHYLHEYALQELPYILDAIIPETPVILLGHSDGASISLMYGAEKSPQVKGIIVEAPHVFVEQQTIEGIRKAYDAWQLGKLNGLRKYHGEKTETVFKAWAETWLSNWFQLWNIEYLLPDITAPILIIQGEEDQYGSSNQVNTIAKKSCGAVSSHMIKNCGHTPHLENQQEVIHLMSTFIRQLS